MWVCVGTLGVNNNIKNKQTNNKDQPALNNQQSTDGDEQSAFDADVSISLVYCDPQCVTRYCGSISFKELVS
jgi:hypothetical protein